MYPGCAAPRVQSTDWSDLRRRGCATGGLVVASVRSIWTSSRRTVWRGAGPDRAVRCRDSTAYRARRECAWHVRAAVPVWASSQPGNDRSDPIRRYHAHDLRRLLLGLLTTSVKASMDTVDNDLRAFAIQLIQLELATAAKPYRRVPCWVATPPRRLRLLG